jgi:mono/diheme cytochrome c family protein
MLVKSLVSNVRLAVFAMGVAASAQAADPSEELGAVEYSAACAVCHGAAGDGDGELLNLLTEAPSDLTVLSANNDGEFPWLNIIKLVDGRGEMRSHGSVMPVWGDRFKADLGDKAGPYGSELVVRGRVLSLVYYLESIQQ